MQGDGSKPAEGEFFRARYMPEYGELFQVQKAARRYHFTSPQRSIWMLFFLAFVGAIAALVFWGNEIADLASAYATPEVATAIPIVLMLLAGLLFYWLICVKANYWLSAKWLKERKAPLELTVSTDASGLRLVTAETETFVRWHALERLFVTDTAICFLYGATTLYLPLRAFANVTQAVDFVRSALGHLSPEARKLSESDPRLGRELSRLAAPRA